MLYTKNIGKEKTKGRAMLIWTSKKHLKKGEDAK